MSSRNEPKSVQTAIVDFIKHGGGHKWKGKPQESGLKRLVLVWRKAKPFFGSCRPILIQAQALEATRAV